MAGECILLKDDELLYRDEKTIITRWNTLKPKKDLHIEGPAGLEDKLPFKKAGVNVMVVPDVTPYKKRKVRILNGAHTGFVLGPSAANAGTVHVPDFFQNRNRLVEGILAFRSVGFPVQNLFQPHPEGMHHGEQN